MDNLETERYRINNFFSVEDCVPTWQKIILMPLVIPIAIFWGIIDFFFIGLPDAIFNPPLAPSQKNMENVKHLQEAAVKRLEIQRERRVEEIKNDLFSAWD